ncbi:MAG: glycosyltransferase [Candidatus Altiarchaeota archaeon]
MTQPTKSKNGIRYSVIIPVYNSSRVIEKCMSSIHELDYSNRDFEVIVVDDCSTDDSVKLAKKHEAVVIKQKKNAGPGAARNAGAKVARGSILMFVDADVAISSDSLKRIDEILKTNKDRMLAGVMGICSPHHPLSETPSRIYNYFFHTIHAISPKKMGYPNTSLLAVKKGAFDSVGGFHPSLRICEDNELGFRLSTKGFHFLIDKGLQFTHLKKMGWWSAVITPFKNSLNRVKFPLISNGKNEGLKSNTRYFYVNGILSVLIVLSLILTPIITFIPFFVLCLIFFAYNRYFLYTVIRYERNPVFLVKSVLYLYSYVFFAAVGGVFGVMKWRIKDWLTPVFSPIKLILLGYTRKYGSKQPISLTYFVTAACNARCRMCFYWKNIKKVDRKNELTLGEVRSIASSMDSFQILMLSGGEPFLRDDLAEIVEAFYRFNAIETISIPTNALQPEVIEEVVREILFLCPGLEVRISLSLDGIGKLHDEIRGVPGAYSKVMETKHRLEKIRQTNPNLKLYTAFTLSSYNQNELGKFVDYAISDGGFDDAVIVLARGNTREEKAKDVDINRYLNATEKLTNHFLKGGIIKAMMASHRLLSKDTIAAVYRGESGITPCYGGMLNAVLAEDGSVYPCEMLNKKLGNLRASKYDFKSIWSGKKAREIRRWIADSKCTCTHECNIPFNIIFNYRQAVRSVFRLFR